jgi:hypothetical protein
VDVEETCAVTFTNDTGSVVWDDDDLTVANADDIIADDPTMEEYLAGSFDAVDGVNSMMWWTNHDTVLNFDVDVTLKPGTAGATVLANSTINFVDTTTYGDGDTKAITAGTGTLAVDGYTLSDISLTGTDPNYLPPGAYEVLFTVECDTP